MTTERESGKDVTAPKHGKIDPKNAPHVGGNTWAGGTGGRDTAGLGGKGGPYRLDAGHDVTQVRLEYLRYGLILTHLLVRFYNKHDVVGSTNKKILILKTYNIVYFFLLPVTS